MEEFKTKTFRKGFVEGSPYQVGDKVKILDFNPDEKDLGTYTDLTFVGQVGKVIELIYVFENEYPHRPLMNVEFESEEYDSYWPEEVEKVEE